jgi:hypothetical protein
MSSNYSGTTTPFGPEAPTATATCPHLSPTQSPHPIYTHRFLHSSPIRPPTPTQCGATIEHLPHEFKLLWHNDSIRPGGSYSDCNLPSLCARCRGRDGTRRQPADLMAAVPCGFCRCAGDLGNPPYITPPGAKALGEEGVLSSGGGMEAPQRGIDNPPYITPLGGGVLSSGGAGKAPQRDLGNPPYITPPGGGGALDGGGTGKAPQQDLGNHPYITPPSGGGALGGGGTGKASQQGLGNPPYITPPGGGGVLGGGETRKAQQQGLGNPPYITPTGDESGALAGGGREDAPQQEGEEEESLEETGVAGGGSVGAAARGGEAAPELQDSSGTATNRTVDI